MPVAPGDRFDRYRVEETLGEGGTGRVFRAYDTKLRRDVALKVLRKDAADDPGAATTTVAKAKLVREARLAASLEHENAVKIYDVGELEGTLYIAMEFIAGKTLRALVADPSASWEVRVRWLFDAAKALAAAHALGLIHRDVKPENIMVRADGVVKVLDFGIAKRVPLTLPTPEPNDPAAAFNTVQTAGDLVVGTPSYMAPEQIRNAPLDGRTDEFAWGVVAYELLSGALPWGDKEGVNLLLAILDTTPVPLTERAPALPAQVSDVILRTLAKAPEDRFATMGDVLVALEQYGSLAGVRVAPTPIESATTRTDMAAFRQAKKSTMPPVGSRWLAAAGGAALVVLGAAAAFRSARSRSEPTDGIATQAPTPTAVVVTALPPPKSANADALAAYAAGLQSFRDASFESARQALERAVKLDPSIGEAHVRLAILDTMWSTDELDARRAFKRALQTRATLTPRDQSLVDAFEPYFTRDPPDVRLTQDRLARAAAANPNDAELAFYYGYLSYMHGSLAIARATLQRAVQLDPKFGQGWAVLAGVQSYLGDSEAALLSITQCLEACPSAVDCLWYRTLLHEQSGDCQAFEADVRQWIARDAEDYYGYNMLAKALRSVGKPEDTVVAALEQKWAHLSPERRPRLELIDRQRLALYAGDFARAEKLARELEALVAADPNMEAHTLPTTVLFDVYEETGRRDKLRELAVSFFGHREVWGEPARADDTAISSDPTPELLAALARTGGITAGEARERRDAWVTHLRGRTTEAYTNHLWIYGYAAPARTADDGRAALEALPRFLPLPPFTPQSIADAHIGNAYLVAGNPRDALPYLERAVKTCTVHDEAVEHVRASLHLGQARAALGDKAGACAAFATVVERWGAATPPSRSATTAREARTALGCPR